MGLANKIDDWQAAGLLDPASAAAILQHEQGRQRPVALFAVAGLGLLALALGILLLVAANWDDLGAALKLSVHVALILAAAVGTLLFQRRDAAWAGEGALFLLAALTLAGIALQSQVYQLTGPLWQALAWWAVLASPAILLLGRTRLTAYSLAAMLAALAVAYRTSATDRLGENLSNALPAALILAALVLPRGARNAPFRAGLLEIGLAATLILASLAHLGWSFGITRGSAWASATALIVAAVVVCGAVATTFRRLPRPDAELIAVILGGSLAAVLLALGVPHDDGPVASFAGVLSYFALWGGVAALATRAGWHRLFRIAMAALAIRLFLIYFELFYSLAFTGVGLIFGGVLLIGLAWAWTRIVRREVR